jgi:hypothetical protein
MQCRPFLIIESRGGYHYAILKRKMRGKQLAEFAAIPGNEERVTIENNGLIVLPGTFQGGFKTKMVQVDEFFDKTIKKNECCAI